MPDSRNIERLYRRRAPGGFTGHILRALAPPAPFIMNPRESIDAPLGRWNLYIGGGGSVVPGYVNVDLFLLPGVTTIANAEELPFPDGTFQRVECDAVLEHTPDPARIMAEIRRVLAPGGFAHVVTPFCHPFHAYPSDYRRFTLDGLKQMSQGLEVVAEGWRTGPTATMLVFFLEYVKLWLPWRAWRVLVHGVLGWVMFPLRYIDLALLRTSRAGQIGNHCFLWLRKP